MHYVIAPDTRFSSDYFTSLLDVLHQRTSSCERADKKATKPLIFF